MASSVQISLAGLSGPRVLRLSTLTVWLSALCYGGCFCPQIGVPEVSVPSIFLWCNSLLNSARCWCQAFMGTPRNFCVLYGCFLLLTHHLPSFWNVLFHKSHHMTLLYVASSSLKGRKDPDKSLPYNFIGLGLIAWHWRNLEAKMTSPTFRKPHPCLEKWLPQAGPQRVQSELRKPCCLGK